MLKKLLQRRSSVPIRHPRRLPILIKTDSGFILTVDYSINRRFKEFTVDNLLKTGVDMDSKQRFYSNGDLSDFDSVSEVVENILKDDNNKNS